MSMHTRPVKLVYLVREGQAAERAPRGDNVLRTRFLDRQPLDGDGLQPEQLAALGFGDEYAGMGQTWVRDADVAAAMGALEGELQVATHEHAFIERSEPAIEVVAYSHGVAGTTRAEFQERYARLGRRLRDEDGPARLLCRYVQSHVIGDEAGPDAVGELGFASAEDLTRFVSDPWLFDELLPYEAQFLDHSRTVQLIARHRKA
jgi:hypothetical protein